MTLQTNQIYSNIWIFMQFKKHAPLAPFYEIEKYHSSSYIDYIKNYHTNNQAQQMKQYGIGVCSDTPAFPKIYEFCKLVTGSGLLSSELIIQQKNQIVCNWNGGYHHAKKAKASGFCYINDIVLSILRLLHHYDKVLYIDIDIHHGDGVEEAFFHTNRVACLSLHQYDEELKFYPGTGNFDRVGKDDGKYYSINVPLKPGCTDEAFKYLFKKIFHQVFDTFRPDVIFLQCGADSLIGDVIGRFRLSTLAHGYAVETVLKTGLPIIMSGGGGYTLQNVSRCWAYETSLACGVDLPDKLPDNLYFYEYYKDQPYLHVVDSNMFNSYQKNCSYWKFDKENIKQYALYDDRSYVNDVLIHVLQNVKKMGLQGPTKNYNSYKEIDELNSQIKFNNQGLEYEQLNYKILFKFFWLILLNQLLYHEIWKFIHFTFLTQVQI